MQTIKRSSAAFALVAAVGLQMMCTKLDIPVTKIARNVFSSATPPPVEAKHCPALIVTYPKFDSCDPLDLGARAAPRDRARFVFPNRDS
ncbi:FK506 binding protein [Aureococcus anophagefferens]|nr:FK506 binding protein [Aureococcus anophagefferens]